MTDTTLGRRIAEQRKLLGLSQEAFGEKMGVSRQAISKWEADAAMPEIEKLITMSKLFNVSVGWLLGTEENEQDLSAQIKMAFQPPNVEPPTPKPSAKPASEPQTQEKPPALNWLNIICVVVTLASLMLSILSMSRWEQLSASGNSSMDSALARISELESQLQQIDALEKQDENTIRLINDLRSDLNTLRKKLDAALDAGLDFSSSGQSPSEDERPQYDSLSDWSITALSSHRLHIVTVSLVATPAVDIQSAQFIATRDEETTTDECELRNGQFTAELRLFSENGYQYTLLLTHADGTVERINLSGHGLSDLGSLTNIQASLVEWDGIFSNWHDEEKFVMGWKSVFLRVPKLVEEDIPCQWSDLKICYNHNERLVEEHILNDAVFMNGVDMTQRVISFQIPTYTYHMPRFSDGDQHELRLEGTLTLNGVSIPFSIPVASWLIENQTVVRQHPESP